MTPTRQDVTLLFDVDNTLLDNDAVERDFHAQVASEFGSDAAERYWSIFEAHRRELGYADYLGALQQHRLSRLHDPRLLMVSSYLLDYPFAKRLYPRAREVVARFAHGALTAILSDGDVVFQPRKVERAGLSEAVGRRVLICIHKERELDVVERYYPADHYVLVDDKPRIIAAVKALWGPRVTTVFVRQGHYAHDERVVASLPPADVAVDAIGGLLDYTLPALVGAAAPAGAIGRNP